MLALVAAFKFATIPFPIGIWEAERVVVGRVSSIRTVGEVRIATIKVEQTMKGQPSQRIEFIACKTRTCDSSNADLGERGVYLLRPLERTGKFGPFPDLTPVALSESRPYEISGYGTGRYVIHEGGVPRSQWGFGFSMTPSMTRAVQNSPKREVREEDLLAYIRTVLRVVPRPYSSFQ